jgi:hypothetical protein
MVQKMVHACRVFTAEDGKDRGREKEGKCRVSGRK